MAPEPKTLKLLLEFTPNDRDKLKLLAALKRRKMQAIAGEILRTEINRELVQFASHVVEQVG
jgi:hypothetical protein